MGRRRGEGAVSGAPPASPWVWGGLGRAVLILGPCPSPDKLMARGAQRGAPLCWPQPAARPSPAPRGCAFWGAKQQLFGGLARTQICALPSRFWGATPSRDGCVTDGVVEVMGAPKKQEELPEEPPGAARGAAARAAHPAPRPRFVGFWPGQPGRVAAWGQGPSCGPCPGPRTPCVGSGPCKQAKGHLGPPRPGRIRPRAARGQRLGRKELGRERSEGRGRAPSGQPTAWKGHGGESGYGDKGLARFGQRWGRNPNGEAPSEGSPLRPLRCRHPKDPTEAPGTTPVRPGAWGRAPWGQKKTMGPPAPPGTPTPAPLWASRQSKAATTGVPVPQL